MIKNYLKVAWRKLFKNKGFSVTNILGLAMREVSLLLMALITISVQTIKAAIANPVEALRCE